MDANRIWILGAPDPEMEMIENLLRECGEQVEHAICDGRRVRPDEAYYASLSAPITAGTIYEIECMVTGGLRDWSHGDPRIEDARSMLVTGHAVTIDHHRPGDPGFGRPPAEFLAASSIGQVVGELARVGALDVRSWAYGPAPASSLGTVAVSGVGCQHPDLSMRTWTVVAGSPLAPVEADVPRPIVLAAAADHCLGAAYRGKCPGVNPDALMRWRAASRAQFQRRTVEAVLADVEAATAALKTAKEIVLQECGCAEQEDRDVSRPQCRGSVRARDMRSQHVSELPEAAARLGVCFVATVESSAPDSARPSSRTKVVCQSGTAEQIEAFMRWATDQGLVDIYGDPARGFAGGYLNA